MFQEKPLAAASSERSERQAAACASRCRHRSAHFAKRSARGIAGPSRISAGPVTLASRSAADRAASCSECVARAATRFRRSRPEAPAACPRRSASARCAPLRPRPCRSRRRRPRRGRRPTCSSGSLAPTRGVANVTLRAMPRCVSDVRARAAAASAAVMPGTTSHAMPAASSAAISSCARPNSIGSPPLSRTTTRCVARRIDEALVDELLRGRMLAAALADGELLRARGERDRVRMHERVVEHDVGLLEQACRAQRQEVGRAGAGADEIRSGHRISPAATVPLVASSIRMKLPVAGMSSYRSATMGEASETVACPISFIASAEARARAIASTRSTGDRGASRARALRASHGAGCTAANVERTLVEPAKGGVELLHGLRRLGGPDQHVAARDIHFVGERDRDRVVQARLVACPVERCDFAHRRSRAPRAAP